MGCWRRPRPDSGLIVDHATITLSHGEKQNAAATWKQAFGFHPLMAYLRGPDPLHQEHRLAEPARQVLCSERSLARALPDPRRQRPTMAPPPGPGLARGHPKATHLATALHRLRQTPWPACNPPTCINNRVELDTTHPLRRPSGMRNKRRNPPNQPEPLATCSTKIT